MQSLACGLKLWIFKTDDTITWWQHLPPRWILMMSSGIYLGTEEYRSTFQSIGFLELLSRKGHVKLQFFGFRFVRWKHLRVPTVAIGFRNAWPRYPHPLDMAYGTGWMPSFLLLELKQNKEDILLMEEILHHLICSLSHYLQGFIHPRWCRISSINSM